MRYIGLSLAIALLAPASAMAAASVASPPLVLGGLMVGLVLLAGFIFLLLRTFRNMQATRQSDLLAIALDETTKARTEWAKKPNLDILRDLHHAMLAAETQAEVELYHATLCELSGRYFKADDNVAWELWLRDEAPGTVAQSRQQPATVGEFLRVS